MSKMAKSRSSVIKFSCRKQPIKQNLVEFSLIEQTAVLESNNLIGQIIK